MTASGGRKGWAAAIDKIVRGDRFGRPLAIVCPTPAVLTSAGLSAGPLTMSVGKIARCRREHPDVSLQVWYDLPDLLADPLAIFPSARRDGSVVTLLLAQDRAGNPVIVAIIPDHGEMNVILSVYGKTDGIAWAAREMDRARAEGHSIYEKRGFAASLPQPPVAEATSSSHGPIPSDGTAKPMRQILRFRKKSTEE